MNVTLDSVDIDPPVNTSMGGMNETSLLKVSNFTMPVAGAVHLYQTDGPSPYSSSQLPGDGLPDSRVAPTVVPATDPFQVEMVWALANMSLAGAVIPAASGMNPTVAVPATSTAVSAVTTRRWCKVTFPDLPVVGIAHPCSRLPSPRDANPRVCPSLRNTRGRPASSRPSSPVVAPALLRERNQVRSNGLTSSARNVSIRFTRPPWVRVDRGHGWHGEGQESRVGLAAHLSQQFHHRRLQHEPPWIHRRAG